MIGNFVPETTHIGLSSIVVDNTEQFNIFLLARDAAKLTS